MKRILVISFSLFLTLIPFAISQELNCFVTINTEGVQSAQRDYLRTFKSDIERYMNNTRFTSEDLNDERIQCNLEIFFLSGSGDNRYKTQVLITSQRPIYIGDNKSDRTTPVLRILDANWEFSYTPNQRMNHEEMIFDPLTGFLDFYAYLIIGYDLETYVPLSGSRCFEKAQNTIQMASTSQASSDWKQSSASYSKYGILDELSGSRYNAFRTAFNNYYFDGVDLLATDMQKALKNMLKSIEEIYDVRRRQNASSVVVKQFFDAKSREIAESFQSYPERSVYDQLSIFDEEHRSTYQEWKTKQ